MESFIYELLPFQCFADVLSPGPNLGYTVRLVFVTKIEFKFFLSFVVPRVYYDREGAVISLISCGECYKIGLLQADILHVLQTFLDLY